MQINQLAKPPLRVTVVSIGRSGTSLIARILHEVLGVDFGNEEDHIPRNHNNPDGYFENAEFLALNDRILRAANSWVLSPPPVGYIEAFPSELKASFVAEAQTLLSKYASSEKAFGWKDPRLSFTLPIWREACPTLRPVIAIRKPLSVLSSIAAQLDRPIETLADLWIAYYKRVFAYTSGLPRHFLSFDDLLDNPLPIIMRLASRLEITVEESVVQAKLAKIIRPEQSRHSSAKISSNGATILDVKTLALYAYLRETTQNGLEPIDHELAALLG